MTVPTVTTQSTALPADLNCSAVLPYWPVWAAAQFASNDPAKELLNFVHIFRDGDFYQVESTDCHRAFRYRFPAIDTLWRVPDGGLLLHAKPLRKAVSHSRFMTVTNDMRAVFHGGKGKALDELSSINLAGFYTVWTVADCAKVGTYPNINGLWPDTFTNQPGRKFGFNARYLRDWGAVVEKIADSVTTQCVCNAATTPFVWTADYAPSIGEACQDARLEYLLMPVQVRS